MTPQPKSLVRGGATLAVAAVLAAGCSSGKSTPAATGGTTSPAATTSSSSPAAGGSGPADPAAATTEIKSTWTKYFDSTIDQSQKSGLVEKPDKIAGLVTALAAAAQASKSSATVNSVTFTSPTHATVLFAILLNGTVVVPTANGDALLDPASGKWQVSDLTLCKLGALDSLPAATLTAAGCS